MWISQLKVADLKYVEKFENHEHTHEKRFFLKGEGGGKKPPNLKEEKTKTDTPIKKIETYVSSLKEGVKIKNT